MSRQRDANNPKRALLQRNQLAAAAADHSMKSTRGDEKTPLLNSMGAAAESLMNNSVVGGDLQAGVGWRMAAFLLVNTALGAGMLNYPYAYNEIGGVWAAALMQVILLVFITSTMFILVYCADFNRDDTYHDVLLSMCGKRAQQISACSIMLTCYGINITFLVIIGDQYDRIFNSQLTPEFIEANWWLDRKFTITLTAFLFILPMCYAQRLDFLRHASVLGMFAMLYVAFLTVYEHYMLDEETIAAVLARHLGETSGKSGAQLINASSLTTTTGTPSIKPGFNEQKSVLWFEPLAVVPVLCFAYQTHEVIVPVYACMKVRSIGIFMKASIFGLVILFFLYNLVGAFGYLTFGEDVGADIMSLYDAKDPIVVVGVVALVIKFITTYPPLMFCGRSALDGLYAEFRSLSASEFKSYERARRYAISSLWFLTTVALAVFAPDISVTLQLLGSMASINVFVFPGMCLMSLTRRLRKARLALLLGELPEGLHPALQQQRARDFYLISGSYFGAAMKKDMALRRDQQAAFRNSIQHHQQQQNAQLALNCCSSLPNNHESEAAATTVAPTNAKQFTATFASLLEFENNLTASCNGNSPGVSHGQLNGVAPSSGRGTGTGEIFSSISTPSSSSTTSSSSHDQQQSQKSRRNSLLNGYSNGANGTDAKQLEQLGQQIQRRQQEFERMMTSSRAGDRPGSCCLNEVNSLSLGKSEQQVLASNYQHHSYSACGPTNSIATGPLGATINDSYDDYSDCLERDCPNREHHRRYHQQQKHDHDHNHKRPKEQPLLISHRQSHQPGSNSLASASGAGTHKDLATANGTPNGVGHLDLSTMPNHTAVSALLEREIRYHCQHCHHHSSYQQQSLCLQNSLNYACQQSTTTSLLDKFGASIAPATVAQVGISQCTATLLYLFAVFLIFFGVFIFVLELVSVFGLL